MSTRDRLTSLTAGLTVPQAREAATTAAPVPGQESVATDSATVETRFPPIEAGRVKSGSPKTGPGQLLAFRGQALELESEVARLKAALIEHDGALPVRMLDPNRIQHSKWANRHPLSYTSPQFLRLKDDIAHAGRNVQPILVRPMPEKAEHYELIFGHRRHRACLDLNIPVLAVIWTEPLADEVFLALMDRENRERADLSPYEQGLMYQRAIDENLFRSNRQMAEALGVSHTWVRKALCVAQLPPAIIDCFPSPLEIQHRQAEQITSRLESDRRGILKRAERLRGQRLSSNEVVAQLLETAKPVARTQQAITLQETTIGSVDADVKGAVSIKIKPGVVAPEHLKALAQAVTDFVERQRRS